MPNHPTIAIVGCGFVGSHLADEIPKLLYSQDLFPFRLLFIDFDKWEDRNSANQNVSYKVADGGEFKAITCARYAEGYPENVSEACIEKLTGANAMELLKDTVLVIDAVDNIPTRQLLWGLAKGGATAPCMHVGISRQGDGLITWSSPGFDTFPFNPNSIAGRDLAEQDYKEPPCEMYKYRASGNVLFQAVAKAVAFYLEKDPWNALGLDGQSERGTMTCWTTNVEDGAIMQLDNMYLDNETGFFPVCYPELDLYQELD